MTNFCSNQSYILHLLDHRCVNPPAMAAKTTTIETANHTSNAIRVSFLIFYAPRSMPRTTPVGG